MTLDPVSCWPRPAFAECTAATRTSTSTTTPFIFKYKKKEEEEEEEKRREEKEKRREEGFKVEAFLDALLLWTQPFAYNSGPRRKRKAKEEWNQKHSCHSFPQRNNKLKKAKEIDGAWYGVK